MTIRSKTSSPIDNKEWTRALPKRSAALGGSGPEAMKAKFGNVRRLHDLRRRARAGQIIAEPHRIIAVKLHMQRRIA